MRKFFSFYVRILLIFLICFTMEEDEDDYISFGTPFPEIEEESVLRKKAARELEVRDEKGRQRFHGAFTGGFSAGYFNTVGTKEGWTPSTFVSSRDKKSNDHRQQNPEDFMDEEDFGAFGISTRRIHTTSNFQDTSDARVSKRKFTDIDSVIPGEAPLKDIVRPVRESIGIKILRKLGWKPGQGIGPRIKKSASVKIYGCCPFPESAELEEDDPYAQSFTFAPDDTEAGIYKPKDNVFGLGYSGLSKESVLSARIDTFTPTTTKSWLKKDKKKLTISGQAFGVGTFEDDDEDIYSKDDMSQYDFSDLEVKGTSQSTNASGSKQLSIAHNIVDGFCLASQPPAIKKYYPPPQLPPNFRPVRISVTTKTQLIQETQFKSRHNLSADERSFLLGEKKFQSFQLTKFSSSEKKSQPVVENINRGLPKNSHRFRPFPNDEEKQKRYEEYLILKDSGELHKLIQPPSMTEWEKQQELEEFARAAMLFKPLSSALSAKFESRSHLDVEHEVMDALAKARQENTKKADETRKLVGMHNRKTSEWHPSSLLCKRFNVPNPYPNSSEVSGSQKSKSLFDHLSFDSQEIAQDRQPSNSSSKIEVVEETFPVQNEKHADKLPENNLAVSANKNESTQNQLSETGRPPIDFFKDIFENSSSDEEDSPSAETENPKTPAETEIAEEEKTSSVSTSEAVVPSNKATENKKVGFGVFANLDLDALNQRTPKLKIEQKETSESKCEVMDTSENLPSKNGASSDKANIINENSTLSNDLYGPELPPNYSESSYSAPPKFEPKKKTKHKVKHKHKHHKHKNKKKKKKHSSHKSSEDSSFDSDEDIPPIVILEKFKKLQKVLK